jgi:hypothetical protein
MKPDSQVPRSLRLLDQVREVVRFKHYSAPQFNDWYAVTSRTAAPCHMESISTGHYDQIYCPIAVIGERQRLGYSR